MSHAKTGFVPVLYFRKRQKREVSNLSPESSMAGMETVIVSAEETIEMVSDTLQKRYPSTVFAVRLEDTVEHHPSQLRTGDLPPLEEDRHLHPVPLLEEPENMLGLEGDVVGLGP